MKKILLVIAMLIIASPVLATVSVTATDKGSGVVEVRYNCSASEKVRAFALDITVDNALTITAIRDFNTGESKKAGGGYGIFPGRFADYINASSPNWADTNYNPVAPASDSNAKSGLGTSAITVELGTLYVDTNAPGTSGLLFRLDVNGTTDGNLVIALNSTRGGIVLEDANLAPSPVLTGTKVAFCTTPTNEVGQTVSAAQAVWVGQGFSNGTGTAVVNCAQLGNIISQDTGCVAQGTAINYSYGIAATEPNVAGMTMTDANAALIAAGITASPTITYEPNGLKTALTVDRQSPAAGTVTCGPVNIVVDTNCLYVGRVFTDPCMTNFTVTAAMVTLWNSVGQPNCWCCTSQKRGNGYYTGSSATKTDSLDLAQVKNATNWTKTITAANACLDFNLSGKIDSVDLAKIKSAANWTKVTGAGPPCQ